MSELFAARRPPQLKPREAWERAGKLCASEIAEAMHRKT
jgi:hypothetical protein